MCVFKCLKSIFLFVRHVLKHCYLIITGMAPFRKIRGLAIYKMICQLLYMFEGLKWSSWLSSIDQYGIYLCGEAPKQTGFKVKYDQNWTKNTCKKECEKRKRNIRRLRYSVMCINMQRKLNPLISNLEKKLLFQKHSTKLHKNWQIGLPRDF